MKYCYKCGNEIADGARFCTSCGAALDTGSPKPAEDDYGETELLTDSPYEKVTNEAAKNPALSLEDFYQKVSSKKTRGMSTFLMVICIITAIVSLVALIWTGNLLGILDVVVYVVAAFLMYRRKNWFIPLIVTCYGGLFTVIGVITSGTPTGILALIIGIIVTLRWKNINDAYQVYNSTSQLPQQEI